MHPTKLHYLNINIQNSLEMNPHSTEPSITKETTVGEIVANNYLAAEIFTKYGIDFCCGGGISLQKASEKSALQSDRLISELNQIGKKESGLNQNFAAWEIDYLIKHIIQTHHRFVRIKTEEISLYAKKVARVYGEQYPENITISENFESLSAELMQHLLDEENIVFPLISEIAAKRKSGQEVPSDLVEKLQNELIHMVSDHDGAGQAIKEIRELSNQFTPPSDACTTYRILYKNLELFEEDLHMHVHLENNILFKKAEQYI